MGFFDSIKSIINLDLNAPKKEEEIQNTERPEGFALGIGTSTGELHQRGHAAGLWAFQSTRPRGARPSSGLLHAPQC